MRKCINPNEYGSLLYNNKEIKYINNVINQKRIFRYSKFFSSVCCFFNRYMGKPYY